MRIIAILFLAIVLGCTEEEARAIDKPTPIDDLQPIRCVGYPCYLAIEEGRHPSQVFDEPVEPEVIDVPHNQRDFDRELGIHDKPGRARHPFIPRRTRKGIKRNEH